MSAGIKANIGAGGFFGTPVGEVIGITAIPIGLYLRRVTGKVPPLAVASVFIEALAEDLGGDPESRQRVRNELLVEAFENRLRLQRIQLSLLSDMPPMWLRDP